MYCYQECFMTIPPNPPSGHIRLDERGRPWIDDSNIKVIEVVLDHVGADKWSAEQIHEELGGYLSLAQIYAALAYYYDHQAEFDAEIARQKEECERLWQAQGKQTPLHQKLRKLGLIP